MGLKFWEPVLNVQITGANGTLGFVCSLFLSPIRQCDLWLLLLLFPFGFTFEDCNQCVVIGCRLLRAHDSEVLLNLKELFIHFESLPSCG